MVNADRDKSEQPLRCRDCGYDWKPVRRGECLTCGSDSGPEPAIRPSERPVASGAATDTPEPSQAATDAHGDDEFITVTVRIEDLDDAIGCISLVHGDRCISSDDCGCMDEIRRLEDAIKAAQ